MRATSGVLVALALGACGGGAEGGRVRRADDAVSGARVRTTAGLLEGLQLDGSDVRAFLGVPYAAPPVGDLRWREPQPATPWDGVREAKAFGSRCMQKRVDDDMRFRSPGVSEDCLYLNVWTSARRPDAGLPVLFYIHGGGAIAGDGSEPRYDGAALAAQDLVVVTMNNGEGLPRWPRFDEGMRMVFSADTGAVEDRWSVRYRALEALGR
jgi:para-nitrobenzyl esterase